MRVKAESRDWDAPVSITISYESDWRFCFAHLA
jgi:hypothetical protein